MSTDGDRAPSAPSLEPAIQETVPCPDAAAGFDAELDRLRQFVAGMLEERDAALAHVSTPLRERYEAAVRGQQPALVAVQDGRCPGCGENLPDASRRLVEASLRAVPCSGCLRLVYDWGSTARDLMPRTLPPVAGDQP